MISVDTLIFFAVSAFAWGFIAGRAFQQARPTDDRSQASTTEVVA